MSVFKDYASYYDLLYKTKDYQHEVDYVTDLIKSVFPDAQSLLDLGCGTGGHAFLFEKKGLNTEGVDMSAQMISIANDKKAQSNSTVQFTEGDIRDVRLGRKFDAVVSLFHVMSYQTSSEDLHKTMATIDTHINEGGVLYFDYWYGPGVLTDRPTVRNKVLENDLMRIHRISEPVLYAQENCVDVNFTVLIQNKKKDTFNELHETHKMRYFFTTELYELLNRYGYTEIQEYEWLSRKKPTFETWNAGIIAKKGVK